MSKNDPASPPAHLSKRRLATGIGIYVSGQLAPLCIPLIKLLGLSDSLTSAISAFVFFGLPSLFTLGAIAVLGRDGFNYLKSRVFALFKRYATFGPVSRTRYRIGLALFLIPFLIAWVTPYLTPLLPAVGHHGIKIALVGDAILFVSLLVLGGEFWEKLRGLFVYGPSPNPRVANP